MLGTALIRLEVAISKGDCSQRLGSVSGNNVEELLFNVVIKWGLLALLVEVVSALLEDDFGGTLHVDSPIVVVLGLSAVFHYCRHPLSLGVEMETDEVSRQVAVSDLGHICLESVHHNQHSLLGGRGILRKTGGVASRCPRHVAL